MSGYRIKNWDKFQHWKSGKYAKAPPWIKLYPQLLNDIEWFKLADKDKAILVELWMLASERGGTLPDLKTVCFRLRRSEKDVKHVLDRLPNWIDTDHTQTVYTNYALEEEEEENKKENKNKTRAKESEFEIWWAVYPHKVGKADALKAFFSASEIASLEELVAGVERYRAEKPPDRQWCNPATWLRQQRWLDAPAQVAASPPRLTRTQDAAKRLLEKANGTSKQNGSGCDSESIGRFLPNPASRPGHTVGTDSGPVRGQAQADLEADG